GFDRERDVLQGWNRLRVLGLVIIVVTHVLELDAKRLCAAHGNRLRHHLQSERHRQRFLHCENGRRKEIELMLDVPQMPECCGELASPCHEEPERAKSHLSAPNVVNAVTDQSKKEQIG